MENKEEEATIGLQCQMGTASSTKANGEPSASFLASSNSTLHTLSLSLMESSPIIPVQPTLDDIIAFGGISKTSTDVRSSSRLESRPDVDMPQMEKVMRNTNRHEASCNPGKSFVPELSIVNIPDDEIYHRAERLGVSLGVSEGDVAKSIKGIKLLEEERILTSLHKNVSESRSEEEGLSKVSTLCEDLVEEDDIPLGVEDHVVPLKSVVRGKKTRQRKVYDTNNIRRSSRKYS
jgi:hypothetical protein